MQSEHRPSALKSPYPRPFLGFTLIELVIVVAIVGIALSLLVVRGGNTAYWQQEGFIRRLSELAVFLHYQAIVDQEFYRLEFDFDRNEYTVGVMKSDDGVSGELTDLAADAGNITLELAHKLSPSLGGNQTVIPPPSFPSLAEPVYLPEGINFESIRTMRGMHRANEGGKVFTLFSPRGFSEFAVIHLRVGEEGKVTILINPFTGLSEIFRDHRDFEWTYGRQAREERSSR